MPDRAQPDPVQIVTRLGGVVHRQDLVSLCGRRGVDAAVAEGRLHKPGRSWIRLPDQAEDVYAARGRLGPGHRRRVLTAGSTRSGVLTPEATVVDCALAHEFDAALSVADSALRSRRVSRESLAREALPLPPHQRRRVAAVIEAASPDAANPFESVTRAIALGVPGLRVVPQGDVSGIGHGDLVDAGLGIVVECESHEFHSQPEAFRYDVRRYTRMVLAGWIVVRLVWEDVMHKPTAVHATLVDAVRLAEQHASCRRRA